jgi:hypothetical protein
MIRNNAKTKAWKWPWLKRRNSKDVGKIRVTLNQKD